LPGVGRRWPVPFGHPVGGGAKGVPKGVPVRTGAGGSAPFAREKPPPPPLGQSGSGEASRPKASIGRWGA